MKNAYHQNPIFEGGLILLAVCHFVCHNFPPSINPQFFGGFFIFIIMENDLRLKITDYFSYKPEDRDKIIQELTEFYFERNVSTRTQHEFETSIDQLLFSLQLEYQFALKSENYNRVEIYQKLSRIFWNIKEQFLEANGL